MNTVGPSNKTKTNKQIAMSIFIWDSLLIPTSRPRQTLIRPMIVIITIIINSLICISKTYWRPPLICDAPSPRDVAIPITVVRIAIISIDADSILLFSTLVPRSELTLKALLLL